MNERAAFRAQREEKAEGHALSRWRKKTGIPAAEKRGKIFRLVNIPLIKYIREKGEWDVYKKGPPGRRRSNGGESSLADIPLANAFGKRQ